MASLKDQIQEKMKTAMKAGDKEQVSFARNLHAAIRKKEIDDRVDLDDAGIQKIVGTLLKQRQESLESFRAGNRSDLADKEEKEIVFLKQFLPAQMSESEIRDIVAWAVAEAKASTPKDLGAVMKLVLPKPQGKADGKLVSQLVKEKLGG